MFTTGFEKTANVNSSIMRGFRTPGAIGTAAKTIGGSAAVGAVSGAVSKDETGRRGGIGGALSGAASGAAVGAGLAGAHGVARGATRNMVAGTAKGLRTAGDRKGATEFMNNARTSKAIPVNATAASNKKSFGQYSL